jgi:hypothetical protein
MKETLNNTESSNSTKPVLANRLFKYINLKNPRTTETLETVDVSSLTKKELNYFLNLEIVNENYEIRYEECKNKQTEVYDYGWHLIRKHLNLNFPLKFPKTHEELMKEYPNKFDR